MRSLECTDTTTTSSRSSNCGSWSSEPSSRMSHSMPVSSRNGAQVSFSAATTSNCRRSRSGDRPRATVSRGEWSVSAAHSWPSAAAVLPISSIGLPPSDQSECRWQSPRSSARNSVPSRRSGASASPSSFSRYPGVPPASASRTTWAVFGPTPLSDSSDPASARSRISSSGSSASTRAAVRKARTR